MMSAERFTVLVVNDEPVLHRILHNSLRSSGFAVEGARTAEEALVALCLRTLGVIAANEIGQERLQNWTEWPERGVSVTGQA